MKVTSTFAIVDVKQNRHHLKDRFDSDPDLAMPALLIGALDEVASQDDGVSIEFAMAVDHIVIDDRYATLITAIRTCLTLAEASIPDPKDYPELAQDIAKSRAACVLVRATFGLLP